MLKILPLLSKFYKVFSFAVFFLLSFTITYGQSSCNYILNLNDSFGDGWNGSVLTVTIDGVATDYTLDDINDDGFSNSFEISIVDGATIVLSYLAGGFQNEVSYSFVGPEDLLLFLDGPNPQEDEVFNTVASCPSCPRPFNITTDVGGITTEINWSSATNGGTYTIQYGLAGIPIDSMTTLSTTGNSLNLTGLTEDTDYEFYISLICGIGDTSSVQGPLPFTTIWLIDVGIAEIISPGNECGLTNEGVKIALTNYGHLPQSLITFRYSVNGVDAGVPMFTDGFFTNVLSTSDTVEYNFETNFDFSEPGVYEIIAWTEFEDDGNINNDSAYLTITSIPTIDTYPYIIDFEEWNGGWTVSGQNSSWEFGEPSGTTIPDAVSGVNAWVTNLDGIYNDNELAYLLSPCFDFSNETDDPNIAFSINYDFGFGDGAWLEGSTDGGTTWQKIGAFASGENWYNDIDYDLGDVWTSSSDGWINAEHPLTGYAGQGDVRFRFAVSTETFNFGDEGIGLDNIYVSPPLPNDLGSNTAALVVPNEGCGEITNNVSVQLENTGFNPQTGFDVYYQVDDNPPVMENVGALNIMPGETEGYAFTTLLNLTEVGEYTIKVWSSLNDDPNWLNDTTFTKVTMVPFISTYPYFNNFETNNGGWSIDGESVNASWAFGAPDNVIINEAASGTNAWVTGLGSSYNPNETSFLLSPCFDFSGEAEDPLINFSINFQNENNWDAAWLEGSKDGGTTWERIGVVGSGVNWYNTAMTNTNPGPVWNGNSNGWMNAEHPLEGYGGEADVRFRFGFNSDGSVQQEGTAIDDVFISPPLANDLLSLSVDHTSTAVCGSMNDSITLEIRNAGTLMQSDFDVFYQINNEPVVMETTTGLMINAGDIATYTFATPFESDAFGATYNITAWVALSTEQNVLNDTSSFSFTGIIPDQFPMVEDFEDLLLPDGWVTDGNINFGHNSPSVVMFKNIYLSEPSFEVVTFPIGTVSTGQNLTFDYRYVNFFAGTEATSLAAGDSLEVQISMDCGETYFTELKIDASNHVVSNEMANMMVNLDAYAGEYIMVRFFAGWVAGDYYLDLDNINIIGCPDLFEIDAMITNETPGANDGSITLTDLGGQGPYEYEWNTGETSIGITGVGVGEYAVTVTDVNGCVGEKSFGVNIVDVENVAFLSEVSLIPNPTRNTSTLEVAFTNPVDVEVQMLNPLGQILLTRSVQQTSSEQFDLDLSQYPIGMYFVIVKVDDQVHVEKLIRAE